MNQDQLKLHKYGGMLRELADERGIINGETIVFHIGFKRKEVLIPYCISDERREMILEYAEKIALEGVKEYKDAKAKELSEIKNELESNHVLNLKYTCKLSEEKPVESQSIEKQSWFKKYFGWLNK